ncbi:MAG TPA: DUF3857 domain-containing protein [Candidatus Polarisedimenticolaceae bacterium]|nr:DUF3857 domain-containing protein [Candidatus Polarisedimenticolaceae bacterium]
MKAAAVLFAVLVTALPSFAGTTTDIEISPGSIAMSGPEKEIAADPAKGIQHGVILIDETERDDNHGTNSQIGRHVRAKILSAEGRGLADVAIPFEKGNSSLKKWWGRTILPDGNVLELREDELKSQSVAKTSSADFRELRGSLPGVVPGCVIDYGYLIEQDGFQQMTHVFLQTDWPVRAFRYRWVPSKYYPAAYVLSRAEGLPIGAKHDSGSVLVTGHDLDTVPIEPKMPPDHEARASVIFYYTTADPTAQEYWDLRAKRMETQLKSFIGNGGAIREVLEGLKLPQSAPLEDKLRAAYDWIGANVKNTLLKSAEEAEAEDRKNNDAYNAKTVLRAKEGSPRQLDYLFAGMARALGAEADVVFAVDRTDRYWNKALKTFEQFGYSFVAVRAPGEPDGKLVFVDAGSTLPYGEVPWRATGANALLCTPKGSGSVLIPPTSPALNRADTHVKLKFSDDNESMVAQWSRTAIGAYGTGFRIWLRDLDTRERKEKLDEICGAEGRSEVTAAELPGLTEASGPFQIACDLEMSDTNLDGAIARYSLPMSGPWWPETPDFPAAKRVHPIIFDYPKLDILAIDVEAPHGFVPKDPPAPVTLDSQYGRYQLSVTKTATGYHVDRAFALTVLIAKPPEYDGLRAYFASVRKADQTMLAFERQGGKP